jgi:Response regulator containing CheY-like receiver, AAA-type ATPase, and DNA-binding domains
MDDTLRVLLVDDEESYLETAAKIFKRKGIEAELCTIGRDVVTLLQEKKCQVVVLDLKMPGMTGQEVLRRSRAIFPPCRSSSLPATQRRTTQLCA